MRRVWGMYALRWLARPFIRVSILAIATVAIVGSVSVSSVLANATQKTDVFEFVKFALSAFINTRSVVQLAILILGVIILWSVVDLTKSLQRQPSLA